MDTKTLRKSELFLVGAGVGVGGTVELIISLMLDFCRFTCAGRDVMSARRLAGGSMAVGGGRSIVVE